MRKNIYKKQYGFSLIETLIAVAILMIAIVGPLSLVQAGLFSSIHQRNQVTAIYLAQEAFELIKNIRDTNSYTRYDATPNKWLGDSADGLGQTSLFDTCAVRVPATGSGCYIDPHKTLNSGNLFIQSVLLSGNSDLHLKQPSTEPLFYNYSGPVTTPYVRNVIVTPIDNSDPSLANEARVTVTIKWNDNSVPRSYVVSEDVYNYEQ